MTGYKTAQRIFSPIILLLAVLSLFVCGFSGIENGYARSGKTTGITVERVLRAPDPPRLVNDFVGIFSAEQTAVLERRVVAFSDSTSNQIAVVIVPELFGYDRAELAYKIGQSWGVGHDKYNNGVVILIKPKDANSSGEAFIATGYGLEGVMPDAVCGAIIRNNMIPHFVKNDYYGAVDEALDVIFKLVSGEISTSEFAEEEDDGVVAVIAFIIAIGFFVVVITLISGSNDSNNMGGGKRGRRLSATDLFLLGMLSNSGSGRSNGGFGSSGGFGGFGGFGGGGFGGGGAGASW